MNESPYPRRLALGLIAGAVLALAGCGRKAEPKPPLDADPLAPRIYPVDRTRRRDEESLPPPVPEQQPFPLPPTPTPVLPR